MTGSHADGSASSSSDVDLFVVFAGHRGDDRRRELITTAMEVQASSPVRLDVAAVSENYLTTAAPPSMPAN